MRLLAAPGGPGDPQKPETCTFKPNTPAEGSGPSGAVLRPAVHFGDHCPLPALPPGAEASPEWHHFSREAEAPQQDHLCSEPRHHRWVTAPRAAAGVVMISLWHQGLAGSCPQVCLDMERPLALCS